ncbi:hypothetical protein STVIR_0657 [Streptomyces viridochromogenes Tue57]|uniref:Uncharacterized protein n=1 Tax=Streptomyces viridochromogenes Tue57 TaxID=1160705 RepID=L8PPI6_STRVR|nr:hypothetical protein STVIR_0657 [Streptomyces viridochromogenes Tue57]
MGTTGRTGGHLVMAAGLFRRSAVAGAMGLSTLRLPSPAFAEEASYTFETVVASVNSGSVEKGFAPPVGR